MSRTKRLLEAAVEAHCDCGAGCSLDPKDHEASCKAIGLLDGDTKGPVKMSDLNPLAKLMAIGIPSKSPLFWKDKAKAIGHMWGGSVRIIVDDSEYCFDLWHHGGEEETFESLLPHFVLTGLKSPLCGYDVHWNAIITEDGIWVHRSGWFRNRELAAAIEALAVKHCGHLINTRLYAYPAAIGDDLIDLEFRRLIEW